MKANNNISPELLDNANDFSDEYFNRFTLRTAPAPLQLNDNIAKDYLFPTLYGDVSCAIGIFLCDFAAAQALLPHPDMVPVKVPGGRAIVTFSCYEYKKVLGVAPYNEIAMTIPIQVSPTFNPPLLPLLMEKKFPKFGYHVFHMPVTSLENQIRGRKIWGLPKVVDDIDIQVENGTSTTVATDKQGNEYFRLSVATSGNAQSFDVQSNLYSVLNNEMLTSQTCFNGTFNVTKTMNRLWNNKVGDNQVALELGNGEYADMLRTLKIDPMPLQTRYTASMNACFDLPK